MLSILRTAAEKLKFKILGSELDVVTKTRYLGLQVDNSLDLKERINVTASKASRAIGFLEHAKDILPIASEKTLYRSIFEPQFRYCFLLWGCCGATTTNQLLKLQNRASRILIESSFNAPSGTPVACLGWKTIRELVDKDSKLMVYKSINGLAPTVLAQSFHTKLYLMLLYSSKCNN